MFKEIKLEKTGRVTLPKEWVKKLKTDKLTANFANGCIILSRVEEDQRGDYSEKFIQSVNQAKADYKAGRVYRANSVRELIKMPDKWK